MFSYLSQSNYVLDEEICVDKRLKMFYNGMNENLLKFHPHIDFQQIDIDVLFKLYLDYVKHPKRSQMKCVQPVKFIMEHMTQSNYTDCGIFLMRHMETYKGEELEDWDVNLKVEDPDTDDQQVQLDDLRRKYATKILTSDLNNLKPTVYSYLPKYDELTVEEKMELDTDKHFDRMQRRISLAFTNTGDATLSQISPADDSPML
ncbi:hypothetical protein LXL04_009218 [Taraxacum kok-saghyz]